MPLDHRRAPARLAAGKIDVFEPRPMWANRLRGLAVAFGEGRAQHLMALTEPP
jgi:hypothetical protein